MFIEEVEISGYTRFGQNGFSKINIKFEKILQIILGSNGSGKSSLKEQLSPLPPTSSSDFVKGGYKKVISNHNGKRYVTVSDYGEHNGHYFECEGEVLNNWGTAAVQKSLVEQHFGLTQDIFDVLCGAKKFTKMSPIERRDWIMALSKIDINPLMHKFMVAKNRQRDAKAYLSKVTERLNVEVKNVVSDKDIDSLTKSLNELKDEFNYYSKFSEETKPTQSDSLEQRMSEIQDFLTQIIESYPKVPQWVIDLGVKSDEDLKERIFKNETILESLKQSRTETMEELAEINKVAEAKSKLEGVGIDESKLKLANLDEQANAVKVQLLGFDYSLSSSASIAKTDFLRVLPDLRQQMFELPDNTDFKFSTESYNKALEMENVYSYRVTQYERDISRGEHALEHYNKADDVNCPKCDHNFKVGVVAGNDVKINEALTNLKNGYESVKKQLAETREFISDCGAYRKSVSDIYNTMKLTPSNEELWVKVKEVEIFKNSSFPAITLLDEHLRYLELAVELESITDLINKENDILIKAEQALSIVNNSNIENVSKIDEKAYNLTVKIRDMELQTSRLKTTYAKRKHIDSMIAKSEEMIDDFNLILIDTLDNDRANFIKETKFNIMKEINSVEQELEQAKVKNAIYRDIQKEHDDAVVSLKDLTLIVNGLSPNTGIIADIMNESIGTFVKSLNNVISSVWTSDVVVLPCVNKKNDLDWKFPVKVEKGLVRQDVSKTSTSQTDIINLSFQLHVSRHIDGTNYPLYPDELGSSMDDQHRINMMKIVSALIENKQCTQIFFISHFAAFHEQFTNNETLVLNPKNILTLPRTYNQHVKFD